MSLRDYNEEIRIKKRNQYSVICVYQTQEGVDKSPLNEMLEKIVDGLKREIQNYASIQLAYVYETQGLQGYVPFESLTYETEPYYTERIYNSGKHELDHLVFMGLGMLEHINAEECGECRLYIVSDDRLKRVNEMIWKDENETTLNPRFDDLNARIILIKKREDKGDEIEEILSNPQYGEVVFC